MTFLTTSSLNMKKIIILINKYLPGYKAGGPIQTIANMVEAIGDRYRFYIVTFDRDFGDLAPYPNIVYKQWMDVGKAKVRYLHRKEISFSTYKDILNSEQFDLLYFQSFFNPLFTILPIITYWVSHTSKASLLIAPRGEFGSGAIKFKQFKKSIYLFVFRHIIYKQVPFSFHCSSQDEVDSLHHELISSAKCYSAIDFSSQDHVERQAIVPHNTNHAVRIAFLARLDPKKNIDFALTVLKGVQTSVIFDIYGNTILDDYVCLCKTIASSMPDNIRVSFAGTVSHDEVLKILSNYDLFFFPTKNENFGHSIHEALRAGLPVLCSDQTPWHELESRNAGWEIPLDRPDLFKAKIEQFAAMTPEERYQMRLAALQYGIDVSHDKKTLHDNIAMFDSLLGNHCDNE